MFVPSACGFFLKKINLREVEVEEEEEGVPMRGYKQTNKQTNQQKIKYAAAAVKKK